MTALIGHEEARRAWRSAMASDRMHHAWLLSGRQGLGKAAFARDAARALVGAGETQSVENHPDILTLSRGPSSKEDEKKQADGKPFNLARNIKVDQVRAMQRRLTTRPTLSDCRAIIIDSADDLEKSAVNALLKSLEEPPRGTIFFLVSHRAGGLLPTVRSRCRTLRFAVLTDKEVEQVLAEQRPEASEDERRAAAAAAQGSPGRAIAYLDEKLAPLAEALRAMVAGESATSHSLASALGTRPDKEKLQSAIQIARSLCADRLAVADREERARLVATHGQLVRMGSMLPVANFDPALVAVEIGGLLARAAIPKHPDR